LLSEKPLIKIYGTVIYYVYQILESMIQRAELDILSFVCKLTAEPDSSNRPQRSVIPPYAKLILLGESILVERDIRVWNHKLYADKPVLVRLT
jgi:hypothetical protein